MACERKLMKILFGQIEKKKKTKTLLGGLFIKRMQREKRQKFDLRNQLVKILHNGKNWCHPQPLKSDTGLKLNKIKINSSTKKKIYLVYSPIKSINSKSKKKLIFKLSL